MTSSPAAARRSRVGLIWIIATIALMAATFFITYFVAKDQLTAQLLAEWAERPEIENWALPETITNPKALRYASLATVIPLGLSALLWLFGPRPRKKSIETSPVAPQRS